METTQLSVTPEPPPDEREALEAAVTQAARDDGEGAADAWGNAALREATERSPSP